MESEPVFGRGCIHSGKNFMIGATKIHTTELIRNRVIWIKRIQLEKNKHARLKADSKNLSYPTVFLLIETTFVNR